MPIMEAFVERAKSPQLRVVGAGDGGKAIRGEIEPLESRSSRWGKAKTVVNLDCAPTAPRETRAVVAALARE